MHYKSHEIFINFEEKKICKVCLEFDMHQPSNFLTSLHIFWLPFKKFRQHGQVGQHKSDDESMKGRWKFFVAQLDHVARIFLTTVKKYEGSLKNLKVNSDTYQTPYKLYKNIVS